MTDDATILFSKSYREADSKFLDAANASGGVVRSYVLNSHIGLDGEPLVLRTLRMGGGDISQLTILMSGVHGVEGYLGSAVQLACLREDILKPAGLRHGVLFVHAVNPYGFSYNRRVNERNVDINRNFLDFTEPFPRNELYTGLHKIIGPESDLSSMNARLASWIEKHGLPAYQAAFTEGQYEFPDGVYYGGREASWSQLTLWKILRDATAGAQRILFLDVHTGLGGYGELQPIHIGSRTDLEFARAQFRQPIASLAGGSYSSPDLQGTLGGAISAEFKFRQSAYVALEVGTRPLSVVVDSLRRENWHYNQGRADAGSRKQASNDLRDAFYPDEDAWKRAALDACLTFIKSAR